MVYRVLMGVRRCISGRKYSGGIEIFQFSLTLNFFFCNINVVSVFDKSIEWIINLFYQIPDVGLGFVLNMTLTIFLDFLDVVKS